MGKTKEEIIDTIIDKSFDEDTQLNYIAEEAYNAGFEAFRVKAEEGVKGLPTTSVTKSVFKPAVLETIKEIK